MSTRYESPVATPHVPHDTVVICSTDPTLFCIKELRVAAPRQSLYLRPSSRVAVICLLAERPEYISRAIIGFVAVRAPKRSACFEDDAVWYDCNQQLQHQVRKEERRAKALLGCYRKTRSRNVTNPTVCISKGTCVPETGFTRRVEPEVLDS